MDDAQPDKLRVLHVIPGLGLGGAETVLFRLISSQSRIEHEVVCLGDRDWYSSLLEERGIRVHHLGRRGGTLGGLMRLAATVRDSRASVIQCWMYRANLMGGLVGRIAGIPTIWNIRSSSLEPFGPGARFLARSSGILARSLPTFIVNCSRRSQEMHARLGYRGGVIPNGYDPEQFYPEDAGRQSRREALGISANTFLIGSISRWNAFKDIPTLLRGLRQAADRNLPVHCLLAGVGLEPANPQLAKAIREHGCECLVTLLGQRADIGEVARTIDLHVLASVSEGFPNAVAETMLSGTPNLVTDVGNSAFIAGDTGWIIAPGDPPALASAIEQAFAEWKNDPTRWKQRREAARRRIVNEFAIGRAREAYEELWRKFARKQPLRRRRQTA